MTSGNKNRDELLNEIASLKAEVERLITTSEVFDTGRLELNESESRYRNLVELAVDAIFMGNSQGNIISANRSAVTLTGFSLEELLSKNLGELFSEEEHERTPLRYDLLKKGQSIQNERMLTRKDGSRVPISMNSRMMPDGTYHTFMRDNQERKAIEERYRQLATLTSDYVHCCTRAGKAPFQVQWVDGAVKAISGYQIEDVLTFGCFLPLVHPEDREAVNDYLLSLVPGDKKSIEFRIVTQEQGIRWVHEQSHCEKGKSEEELVLLGAVTDITERKINEVALQAATQAAEAASRAKSVFLAKVSHEIRTPLTSIVGFGELMEGAELTSEHRKYLSAINAASSTLSLLINDILDLSKIDAGELVVRQEDFQPGSLIKKLAMGQEQQIAKKNLSFNVSVDTDVPEILVGDPLRIQQILLNLVGNAIKFTEQGSISIAVVVAEESNSSVLLDISVIDTGIGIAAVLHERVFEPFVQISDAKSPQHNGSGLGLSISRSLAGLMGGAVELESQEGAGSTFHLLIPLLKKIDDISEKPLQEIKPITWRVPALNILLAEDNQINTQFIKTVIENLGHKVMTAENGKVALDKLNTNVFDLVFMDIQMPVMDGIDTLKVLRELELLSGKHLSVIALTAYALIGDKEKYLKMGFDGYLRKPFTTKELVAELQRLAPY